MDTNLVIDSYDENSNSDLSNILSLSQMTDDYNFQLLMSELSDEINS